MNAEEGAHWWFAARRRIVESLIRRHAPRRAGRRVLEAGCGTGGNLAMLAGFGRLDALEYDGEARDIARARGLCDVAAGALPDRVDFERGAYDIVALLDVLEHVEDDTASLRALGERLKEDGVLIVTVPAVPWLWSKHDELHHHHRRYTRRQLKEAIERAGLRMRRIGYFNSLLFPLAVGQRGLHRLLDRDAALDRRPSAPVNALLRAVFGVERFLLPWLRFPIGLSLYAIALRDAKG